MADKEVEVNGKKFGEDTQITLKAKTLIWVIGILIGGISTLATIGYFDIKAEVKNQKEIFDSEKIQYIEEVHTIIEDVLKEDRSKREDMIETIGEMKGDIKVILDRTSRANTNDTRPLPVNNTLNIPTDNLPNVDRSEHISNSVNFQNI